MKIEYEIDPTLHSDEIIIKCSKITSKILEVERALLSESIDSVIGTKENKMFPIKSSSIERIFVENKRTYVFSKGETYEVKKTLTAFQSILPKSFVRISKSCIANTKLIQSIESEFSGNFTLIFISSTKETLSRSYVKDFKSAIGMEG